MSEELPITKYLDHSSAPKCVDLANLCRRLFAEWKYHDGIRVGNYVKVINDCPDVFQTIQKWLGKLRVKCTREMIPFLEELPITKYSVTHPSTLYGVDAKDFKGAEGEDLNPEELLDIYWRLKMPGSAVFMIYVIQQLVDEFRKLWYKGVLLPNGKLVPFDAMNVAAFQFYPEALHLIDYYQLPNEVTVPPTAVIEELEFDGVHGFNSQHFVIAFNLPEEDEHGNLGRLMIMDPTCAQFGMKGTNGEILYWGQLEDYVNAFPAKMLSNFIFGDLAYMNCAFSQLAEYKTGAVTRYEGTVTTPLKNAALSNMNSEFCGYCGEVERKENEKIRLKRCSRCKKISYCDALCQKLAWKSHKLECKSK